MTRVNELINNTMDNIETPNEKSINKPDESSGLLIEARLKISDPESGLVIVDGRA